MPKKDNNIIVKRRRLPSSDSDDSTECSSSSYETVDSDYEESIKSKETKSSSDNSSSGNNSIANSSIEKVKKYTKKDRAEFQQLLASLFPSKYANMRSNTFNKLANDTSDEESEEYVVKKSSTKKRGRKIQSKTSESSISESDDDDYSESDDDDYSESVEDKKKKKYKKGNINFYVNIESLNKKLSEEMEEEMNEDIASELSVLKKDDEYASEDEMVYMADKYEHVDEQVSNTETKRKKKKKQEMAKNEEELVLKDVGDEYKQLLDMKKLLVLQHKHFPTNKFIKKSLKECKESIRDLIKDTRTENTKKYNKLIHDEMNNDDELTYFKKKLSNKEQVEIMKQLKEINKQICFDKPHRLAILQSNMPLKFKTIAMKKLNELNSMEGENEYSKAKLWLDNFMRIPFGTYKSTHISINDGLDTCHDFMVNAKNTLDECVYGLDDAKMQFMQLLGQWVANPNSLGTAIGLYGPPGTGKTSIIKDGLSKILGREFSFIALGGTGDGSFLEGHSYTYEGSMWGKIVQILMDTKCMNPIIYFDELDKVSDSAKGQEIIGILTHLTDITQNSQYHDKYFAELEFDLSKCLFVFSYNDESLINPILRDRMYKVKTTGYETKEKIHIAKKYMLPKIIEQIGFQHDDVIIEDDVLSHIIKNLTYEESGVRNLKRCLETIYTKLNLFRLVKENIGLFDKEMKVIFPYKLTIKEIKYFLKNTDTINTTLCSMYV